MEIVLQRERYMTARFGSRLPKLTSNKRLLIES